MTSSPESSQKPRFEPIWGPNFINVINILKIILSGYNWMPLPGVGSPPHEQKHVCLLFLWSHIFCCITYLQWDGSADSSHPSKKGWGQKWNEMEWDEMVRDQKNESAHFEYFDTPAAQVPFLSLFCWIIPPPCDYLFTSTIPLPNLPNSNMMKNSF